LFAVAALAGLVFTAIAIFVASGYTPDSNTAPSAPSATQTTSASTPPPSPCEGVTTGGCEQLLPGR
jgi:hypothetical protein